MIHFLFCLFQKIDTLRYFYFIFYRISFKILATPKVFLFLTLSVLCKNHLLKFSYFLFPFSSFFSSFIICKKILINTQSIFFTFGFVPYRDHLFLLTLLLVPIFLYFFLQILFIVCFILNHFLFFTRPFPFFPVLILFLHS